VPANNCEDPVSETASNKTSGSGFDPRSNLGPFEE